MIWFFERRRARLHYEIRRQTDGPHYELVITFPDGRQEIERYADAGALTERSISLERTLTADGWAPPDRRTRPAGRSVGSY
jgi:hypothetical protein